MFNLTSCASKRPVHCILDMPGATPVSPPIEHNTIEMSGIGTDQVFVDNPMTEVSSSQRLGKIWKNIYLDNKNLEVKILDTNYEHPQLLFTTDFKCESSTLTYNGHSENIKCTSSNFRVQSGEHLWIEDSITCETTIPLDSQSELVPHKLEQLICKLDHAKEPLIPAPSIPLRPITAWERIKDVGSKIISKTTEVVTDYILPTNIPAIMMGYATFHTLSEIYSKGRQKECIELKDVAKLAGCALGTAVCVVYATPVDFIPKIAIPVTGALGIWFAKKGYEPLAKYGWEGIPQSFFLATLSSVALTVSIPMIGQYSR